MDRVFGAQELDFMLFFSSMVSFFKTPGLSNYAAGCTFKDSFALELLQQRAYPVKIVNWGYWGTVGVAADETQSRIMAQMGVGSIEPEEGMASLQALVSSVVPQVVLIKMLHSEATAGLSLPEAMAHHLARKMRSRGSVGRERRDLEPMALPVSQSAGKATRPGRAPASAGQTGREYVEQLITEKLSAALRIAAAEIETDASFPEYGVDSIAAVTLVRAINETLEIELEPSKLFEYSSVDLLAQYLSERWPGEIAAQRPAHSAAQEQQPMEPAGSTASCTPAQSPDGQATAATAEAGMSFEQVLESVVWQEASLDDGYEKVTF
jgi:polyketide synthase PksM